MPVYEGYYEYRAFEIEARDEEEAQLKMKMQVIAALSSNKDEFVIWKVKEE